MRRERYSDTGEYVYFHENFKNIDLNPEIKQENPPQKKYTSKRTD